MAMTAANEALGKELLELERRYWRAVQDKDVDAALKLSDDPCVVVGAQGAGTLDRATMARMFAAADYELRHFELSDDVQVHRVSEDVAVLAYKVHEELLVDGRPLTLDAADASTWVKRDGGWVCALHTESISGDPFGRDRIVQASRH